MMSTKMYSLMQSENVLKQVSTNLLIRVVIVRLLASDTMRHSDHDHFYLTLANENDLL